MASRAHGRLGRARVVFNHHRKFLQKATEVNTTLALLYSAPEPAKKALSEQRGHLPTDGGSDSDQSFCRHYVSVSLSKLVFCVTAY